jgi:hypothetical protein
VFTKNKQKMERIQLSAKNRLDFEYHGKIVSVDVRYLGGFMVLSNLDCNQEPLHEIGNDESRIIGCTIPKKEIYLAIASILSESVLFEIKSFQILVDEDEAIFLIR